MIQCVDVSIYSIASGVSQYSDILHGTKWSLSNGLCYFLILFFFCLFFKRNK